MKDRIPSKIKKSNQRKNCHCSMTLNYSMKIKTSIMPWNLAEITDLPEKVAEKIIPLMTLHLTTLSLTTISDIECSTADTEILSTAGSSQLLKPRWTEFFDIAYQIFLLMLHTNLDRENVPSLKMGHVRLKGDMKHDILKKLAEIMIYMYRPYPRLTFFKMACVTRWKSIIYNLRRTTCI